MLLKNLLRKKVRSALALLGVALAVAALVALLAISRGFLQQFEELTGRYRGELVVMRRGAPDPLLSELDSGLGAVLAELPGVKAVHPLGHYLTRRESGSAQQLFVFFALPPGSALLRRHQLVSGRYFRAGRQELILGRRAAQQYGVEAGDLFKVGDQAYFRVSGIFETKVHLLDSGAILATRDFFRLRGNTQVNLFVLDLWEGRAGIPAVMPLIAALPHELEAVDSAALLNHLEHVRLMRIFVRGIAWIALVLALLGILNTMMMAVHERTREMGLLSALGWSKARIMLLVIGEGLILALVGGLAGIGLGAWGVDLILAGLGFSLMESPYSLGFFAQAIALALLAGLLGALLPAWLATRITPLEALRHE